MSVDKYLNFGNDTAAQLKKSNEWTCQTAANSPTGKASDCNAILSQSTGIPEYLLGSACCYEWRGSINSNAFENEKVQLAVDLFKMAGYPVVPKAQSAYRCFSVRVLEVLPNI